MPDLFNRPPPAKAAAPKAPERQIHICATCGAPARFGEGVSLRAGRLGNWYCRDHAPFFRKMTQVAVGSGRP